MKNGRNRAPNFYGVSKRNANYEHIIQENCINAYVDSGNTIKGIWDYLNTLIAAGDITEPYAKEYANKALNTIKSSERMYNNILRKEF